MSKLIDLTGQRFGRLLVLYKAPSNKYGQTMWHCRCDCGVEKDINAQNQINEFLAEVLLKEAI